MRILAVLIATLATVVGGFKSNRTSCFHYVSCLESIQTNLKQCAGGAAISLTLEAKDVNIRDLVKYRALEFVGCQDRLLKEIVDFEALQILVNEDARECFEKLPESSKRVEQFTDSCDYVEPVSRNASKGDALQCLIEFKQDREYCESLLECCPDHTRCGERMNAVSLSYQNARVKAEQIVYSMISCIVVNDPRFLREGARLQSLRDPYRNAGVPFLRPDAYTEARITRRLALTSTATLSQRRERFLKKYTQIRQVVAQNLFGQQKPVTDQVTESSDGFEKPKTATEVKDETSEELTTPAETAEASVAATEAPETTSTPLAEILEEVTTEKPRSSEMHVNTIRQLIRNASEKDLSKYVSLISEGKFSELFELAEKKNVTPPTFDEKFTAKMSKLKEIITEALSEKSVEIEKPEEKTVKAERPENSSEEKKENSVVDRTSRNVAEADNGVQDGEKNPVTTTETSDAESTTEKEEVTEEPKKDEETTSEKVEEVKDEKEEKKEEKKDEKKSVKLEKKPETQEKDLTKVFDDKERALLVESEIKSSADEMKNLLEKSSKMESLKSEESTIVPDDIPVLEKEDSAEKKAEETTTTTAKPELLSNAEAEVLSVIARESENVEGSGLEEETLSTTTTFAPLTSEALGVIADVKKIRPRVEQTHCQQYASCWQTVIDYEQQCDRKYSTEVLSHGIDDAEILSILHNSSISHHEIVLKACLRPLDRSVHSTLKQLLVIQRGVRKACLELGRNKIAVTDAEESLCNSEVPSTASIDEFISSVHVRSQSNHLTCRAKLEPIREACSIVRNCCASVETCDNYISSSPVKKLETEAIKRLVKRQNDCETKMLQTLTYIHEQLSSSSRRRRFYYH